jgi:hypothetical protein
LDEEVPVNSRFTVTFAHRNSRSHRSLIQWPIRNAAGLWSGFKLYGKTDDETFRKAVLILLLLAGLYLIVPALIFRGP